MGKGIGCVYEHIHFKWTCPSPNTTFVVLPCYVFSQNNYSTIGCSDSIIVLIRPTPLPKLTTINKVDTEIDIETNHSIFQLLEKSQCH